MIGLSPQESKEKLESIAETKTLPKKNWVIIIFVSFLIIGISVVLSRFVSYDPNFAETEKVLQKLDSDYKIGKVLSDKEFELYCQLLEKLWKKHLKACYCKDGVKNPTPGIDWTNPPSSPDGLGAEWVDVTHEIMRSKSKRRDFIHRLTNEKIVFEFGMTFLDGNKQEDHWHRYNPLSKNDKDLYLDECGKPVGKSDKQSHVWIKNLQPWTP